MRSLLGDPVALGPSAVGSNLLDLHMVGSSVTMRGVAPGVLALVVLRCVLGFCLRTRGFVGFVLVIIGSIGRCSSSVATFSPSEVGTAPPCIITLMAFLISLIAVRCGLFF